MSPPGQNAAPASRTNPFNNMTASTGDPFGMGSFNPAASSNDIDQQIRQMDKELLDLQVSLLFTCQDMGMILVIVLDYADSLYISIMYNGRHWYMMHI